jgi:hypothetical protein
MLSSSSVSPPQTGKTSQKSILKLSKTKTGQKRKISFSEDSPQIHTVNPSDYYRGKKVELPECLQEKAYDRRSDNARYQYKIKKYKILENIRQKDPQYYSQMIKKSQKKVEEMRMTNYKTLTEYYKRLRDEAEISSDSDSNSDSNSNSESDDYI